MKVPTVNLRPRRGKKGTTWQIDYMTPSGERIRKSLGKITKAEAIEKKGQIQKELKEQVLGIETGPKKSIGLQRLFEEYLEFKISDGIRKSTQKRYKNYQEPIVNTLLTLNPGLSSNVNLLSKSMMELAMDDIRDDVNNKNTYNNTLTYAKAVFKYAEREKYISNSPAKHLKKLQIPKKLEAEYFTYEQLQQIWDGLLDHWVDLFKFITLTGLRRAELINLSWKNVYLDKDPEEIKIDIHTSADGTIWRPKNDSSRRRIPLPDEAIDIIKKQKGAHSFYVFCSGKGKKLHPNTLENAFNRAIDKTDINFGSIHTLRHTYASQLAINGTDPYRIKELMGHGSIESTDIYMHLYPSTTKPDVNKIKV